MSYVGSVPSFSFFSFPGNGSLTGFALQPGSHSHHSFVPQSGSLLRPSFKLQLGLWLHYDPPPDNDDDSSHIGFVDVPSSKFRYMFDCCWSLS